MNRCMWERCIYIREQLQPVKNYRKSSWQLNILKQNKEKKIIFFYKKHIEENSTALQKANMNIEICSGNKQCDL